MSSELTMRNNPFNQFRFGDRTVCKTPTERFKFVVRTDKRKIVYLQKNHHGKYADAFVPIKKGVVFNLESNCVDELGKNLSLSGGTDSCAAARDLWVSGGLHPIKFTKNNSIQKIKRMACGFRNPQRLKTQSSFTWVN